METRLTTGEDEIKYLARPIKLSYVGDIKIYEPTRAKYEIESGPRVPGWDTTLGHHILNVLRMTPQSVVSFVWCRGF